MATFSTYSNTLPDPSNPIAETGAGSGSIYGPGYASVTLSSEHKQMNTRTNSGRLISREVTGHKWDIDISYNPMTREQFEPVYSFILQQRGSLYPFYVSLPQYAAPRDSTFATFVASNSMTTKNISQGLAGTTSLIIEHASYDKDTKGQAKPGDIFTITDASDSNHTKAYQVTRVETDDIYLAGTTPPQADELRISFVPALQRTVTPTTSTVVFHNPKFRVILGSDITTYELGTNNLYSFGLKLEEASS